MMSIVNRYVGGKYVQEIAEIEVPIELQDDEPAELSRRQFEWLLAYTGLDDVWDAVEAAAKVNDVELYAFLRAQRVSSRFLLGVTLKFVAHVRDLAASVAPGADLSDETITAAWDLAAGQSFDTLIPE